MRDKVYAIGCEFNDKGWHYDSYFFMPEDALKAMRKRVAEVIRKERSEGKRITHLNILRDTVMGDASEKSQMIFFKADDDLYDFRVWAFKVQ